MRVRFAGPALGIDVQLADGRAASRLVSDPEDVVPTVLALTLVPPEPSSELTQPAARAAAPQLEHARASKPGQDVALGRMSGSRSSDDSEAKWRLEMSLLGSARTGDGRSSLGLGASSLVDWRGWLLGLQGRGDSYERSEEDANTTLQLAALVGRRWRHQSLALDVLAGPALTLMNATVAEVGPEGRQEASINGGLPRFLCVTPKASVTRRSSSWFGSERRASTRRRQDLGGALVDVRQDASAALVQSRPDSSGQRLSTGVATRRVDAKPSNGDFFRRARASANLMAESAALSSKASKSVVWKVHRPPRQ